MNQQTVVFSARDVHEATARIQHLIHSHDTLARRNAQETIEEAKTLLALAQNHPSLALYVPDLFLTLGIFFARGAHYEHAATHLYQAIPLLEQRQDTAHLPTAWNYLGLVYSQIGDLEAALTTLLKGVQVATDGGHPIRRASCLNDVAYLYIELGNPTRAVQYLEECLFLLNPLAEAEPQSLLAAVWDSLALCYVALEEYSRAEQYARQAFAHAERFENPWGIANVWQTLGQIAVHQKAYDHAITAYSNAHTLAHEHGFAYQEAQALLHCGKAFMERGDFVTATDILFDALKVAETIGAKPILHRVYEALATMAERQGDFENAYHHYKQFHHLRDEHYGERLEQRVRILSLLQDLDTAHHETQSAHRENEALQREIAERTRLQAVLEHLATIDDLTQLLNRRHFFALVDQHLQGGNHVTVGFMVMDIDHFKRINDHFGHEAGDAVLQEVANRLSGMVPPTISVGRYGGEEFMLFLPDTDPYRAHIFAQEVLDVIRTMPFVVDGEPIAVTASIGVVTLPLPIDRPTLFQCADQALYQAKSSGRNQVVIYNSD